MRRQPQTNDECRLCCLVEQFADAMQVTLLEKASDGVHGWDDPAWATGAISETGSCKDKLARHVARLMNHSPQEVDIANLAMFHWNGRRTECMNRDAEIAELKPTTDGRVR